MRNIRFGWRWIAVGFAICALGASAFAVNQRLHWDPEVSAPDVKVTPELIERGQYLTQAADCAACHNAPGGKPFTGGVPFEMPFGTIYSTNITADLETGIGTWSDDDFVRALHRGVRKDGSNLYPAFPYTSYTGLSRDDAVAIKAYLFSLPPIHQPSRENELAFPFNQRWGLTFWNLVFLKAKRFDLNQGLGDAVTRGDYLTNVLGHCGECHTPRNLAFALDNSRPFTGAVVDGWRAYNITSSKASGIGGWTDAQIKDYLGTGHAEGRGAAVGPMGEAVSNSLRFLSPSDLSALTAYLRTIPPHEGGVVNDAQAGSGNIDDTLGMRLFDRNCSGCHLQDGKGRQNIFANFLGSHSVRDPGSANLLRLILDGTSNRALHPGAAMPGFAKGLNDEEVAALANYLAEAYSDKKGDVSAADVRRARHE